MDLGDITLSPEVALALGLAAVSDPTDISHAIGDLSGGGAEALQVLETLSEVTTPQQIKQFGHELENVAEASLASWGAAAIYDHDPTLTENAYCVISASVDVDKDGVSVNVEIGGSAAVDEETGIVFDPAPGLKPLGPPEPC